MGNITHSGFGTTGWQISSLALRAVDSSLSREQKVALLLRAFERGVNLVEPDPGGGEAIVGEALRQWREQIYVATRVSCDAGGAGLLDAIETSRRRLGREQLDLVLLDGATEAHLDGALLETLVTARQQGQVARLGAAAFGVDAALATAKHPELAVLQFPFSLLDQRATAADLFTAAESTGTALLASSPLLGGVLCTERAQQPEPPAALMRSVQRGARWAGKHGDDLTTGALRFCLAQDEVDAVLVGARNAGELDTALAAAEAPRLPRHRLSDAAPLAVNDEQLLDPRRWAAP